MKKRCGILFGLALGLAASDLSASVFEDVNADFMIAVIQCDRKAAEKLLAAGADVNAQEQLSRPLNEAVFQAGYRQSGDPIVSCYTGMMKFLLANGANVNAKNAKGETALMVLARLKNDADPRAGHNRIPTAELLLKYKPDLFARNNENFTAFSIAVWHGDDEMLRFLLGKVKSLREAEQGEIMPLLCHAMVFNDEEDVVKILLKKKAEVNAPCHEKTGPNFNAPIHLAVARGNSTVARLLLDYGADVRLKNVEGETPMQLAIYNHDKCMSELGCPQSEAMREFKEIVEMLKKAPRR